jgi:hypothetical protein
MTLLTFFFGKKKDLKIAITGVRKHGYTRRSVLLLLYIIYIYIRKERRKHPLHPRGITTHTRYDFINFLFWKKKGFENRLFETRKHGWTRRPVLLLLYIYIYIYRKERRNTYKHTRSTPRGITIHTRFLSLFFI